MSDTSENSVGQADKRPQMSLKILNERLKILEQNWVTGPEMKTDTLEKLVALYIKNRFAGALTQKIDLWLDTLLEDIATNPLIKKIESLERENADLVTSIKLLDKQIIQSTT